jgi:hypothetical protein
MRTERQRVGHARLAPAILVAAIACTFAAAAPPERPAFGVMGDRLPELDPNAPGFPDSSLVDFSHLLDGPTTRHGFLFPGSDGQMYFEDGTRGRFWGINVAKRAVFQPTEVIDAAVDAIARAGFNLVRLHHIDGITGLLPPERAGTDRPMDPDKLAAVDHWIAALGRRGIYVYLDLLDFRTFSEAERVPEASVIGRGAKPYAVFNERLIELQMDYARRLLVNHINPETGLSYAGDPTVCMIELCDENGLFLTQRRKRPLVSPYWEELTRRWNFWLRARYGDTDTLRNAWTDWQDRCALQEGETLEAGTVTLHGPGGERGMLGGAPGATGHEAGRANDMALFLYSVHRDYFSQMAHFLRERGVQQPIGAVTDFDALPDMRAMHDELDFIGTNYYYDHPRLRDGQWRLPMYFVNHTPLGDQAGESFAPRVTRSAFADRPIVVREWGVCWPNKFRAAGMVEAIAYACLQDIDTMILFTYDTSPEATRLDFFDVKRDPLRWGLAGRRRPRAPRGRGGLLVRGQFLPQRQRDGQPPARGGIRVGHEGQVLRRGAERARRSGGGVGSVQRGGVHRPARGHQRRGARRRPARPHPQPDGRGQERLRRGDDARGPERDALGRDAHGCGNAGDARDSSGVRSPRSGGARLPAHRPQRGRSPRFRPA